MGGLQVHLDIARLIAMNPSLVPEEPHATIEYTLHDGTFR
jgi:hypothetical protein